MKRFPVTMVGSWPRSQAVLRAQKDKQAGRISFEEFEEIANPHVEKLLKKQEELGVDIVTDGELRRDNFYSFVAERLDGVQMMTLAEMLDHVEDKEAFERLLQTLDVPAFAIRNPTAVGRISPKRSLALEDFRFAASVTNRPIKVPLPGPYILTRAMWVPEVTGKVYASKEELGEDVVRILGDEVEALAQAGAAFIQFDEPVLTELVFTQGQTRTFMCAALSAGRDPKEELEFAVDLINRVAARAGKVRTGVHICRGNWSQDESTLLSGSYRPLQPYLERMNVDQLVLEYATARAGDLVAIEGKELGYGAVNPRTETVESVDSIVAAVRDVMKEIPGDQIMLNPDCGFATFSMRPMNEDDIATRKMAALVAAAEQLRAES